MITAIIIIIGGLISIFTKDKNYLQVAVILALLVMNLKQSFHGYEIQKLKERIDA